MKTKPAKFSKKTKPVEAIKIIDSDTAMEALKNAFGGDSLRVTFKDVTGRRLNALFSLSANIIFSKELNSVMVSGRWGLVSRVQDLEIVSMISRDRESLAGILGDIATSIVIIKTPTPKESELVDA